MRGDEHKQAGFFAHFQGLDHNGFLEDTEITFIDKTDPSDPTRREGSWIDTLKTRYPLGLNNIDAYHKRMLLHFRKSLMFLWKNFYFLCRTIF